MKFPLDVKPHYFLISLLALLAFPQGRMSGAESTGVTYYQLDPQKSQFLVTTGTAGIFGGFGHKHKISIPDFSGKVAFNPSDLSHATLQVNVAAKSLVVVAEDKKEEKDKPKIEEDMQTKVLEVEKFPEINFRSSEITLISVGESEFNADIRGEITLHGVTRNITIPAKVTSEKGQLTARGEFTLKQTDYQIKPASAGGGTVKVKDELRLTFSIVAHP